MTRAEAGVDVRGSLVAGCTANLSTECRVALRYRALGVIRRRVQWEKECNGVRSPVRDAVDAWYDGALTTMTSSRVAVLTGGAAVLAAWLSSAAGTVPSAPVTDGSVGVGVAPAQSLTPAPARLDLEREVARLSSRLETARRPRNPARNPFTLAARTPATTPPPSAVALVATPAPSGVDSVAAEPPAVSLAGIGVERTSYGRRRTAILSADGRVFLARIGDEVIGRFQVRGVTDDAVELLDLRDGTPFRLTLP